MPVIRITSKQLNQILGFFPEFVSLSVFLICIHVSSAVNELALITTFTQHLFGRAQNPGGLSV